MSKHYTSDECGFTKFFDENNFSKIFNKTIQYETTELLEFKKKATVKYVFNLTLLLLFFFLCLCCCERGQTQQLFVCWTNISGKRFTYPLS